jgi:hypothetical protein
VTGTQQKNESIRSGRAYAQIKQAIEYINHFFALEDVCEASIKDISKMIITKCETRGQVLMFIEETKKQKPTYSATCFCFMCWYKKTKNNTPINMAPNA